MSAIVVCDAGPLIHLDELNCLSLLADFESVLIPEQVWQEVMRHRPQALESTPAMFSKIYVVLSPELSLQALVRSLSLDLGEQAALTLMRSYPNAIFLTDDAAARLAATTLGYAVHGTIGILIRAIRRQQKPKDEVLTILRDLPNQSTLHIRLGLLREIIGKVEREA